MANDLTGRRCTVCRQPINQNQKRTENDAHYFPCDPKGRIVREDGY